jgi:hypothetical protein
MCLAMAWSRSDTASNFGGNSTKYIGPSLYFRKKQGKIILSASGTIDVP